jgi:hypothetical protein
VKIYSGLLYGELKTTTLGLLQHDANTTHLFTGNNNAITLAEMGTKFGLSTPLSGKVNSVNIVANKLLVLYDPSPSDTISTATNFYGFGINSSAMRLQLPSANNYFYIYSGNNLSLQIYETGASTIINTSNTNLYLSGSQNIRLDSSNVINSEGHNQNYRERLNALGNNYIVLLATENGNVSGTYNVNLANVVRVGRMVNLSISMEVNVTGLPGGGNEWRLNFPSPGFPQFYNQDNNWGPCTPNTTFANSPLFQYYVQATSGTQLRINQYGSFGPSAGSWGTPAVGTPLQVRVVVSFSYISN